MKKKLESLRQIKNKNMDENDIKNIMEIIINSIKGKDFIWRVEGSVGLKMRGIEISVNDLDIITNEEGMDIFREALEEYIVEDSFSKRINGVAIICDINGFEVEIDFFNDLSKNMFEKHKRILWKGLQVLVLPLEYVQKFYEIIGRGDRVELIKDYLNKNKITS